MRVQWKTWSAIVVGAVLMGVGCGPSDSPMATQSAQVGRQAAFCGGLKGVQCPDGFSCVDDPSDDCDPKNGGADCGGICVKEDQATVETVCGHEPGYNYLFRDPAKCAGVRFKCQDGQEAFFNDCGCGCKPAS